MLWHYDLRTTEQRAHSTQSPAARHQAKLGPVPPLCGQLWMSFHVLSSCKLPTAGRIEGRKATHSKENMHRSPKLRVLDLAPPLNKTKQGGVHVATPRCRRRGTASHLPAPGVCGAPGWVCSGPLLSIIIGHRVVSENGRPL